MSSPPSPTIVRLMIFGGTWPSPYFPGWVGIVNGLVPPVLMPIVGMSDVVTVLPSLVPVWMTVLVGVVVGVATIGWMFGQTLLWVWWSALRRLRY